MIRNAVEQSAVRAERARSTDRTSSWLTAFWLIAMAGFGVALWLTLFGVGIRP